METKEKEIEQEVVLFFDPRITIIQLDKENSILKEWVGIGNAAKILDINRASLQNCLSGKSKSCGGFKWKYKTQI